ncbi:hypothetical protein [Vannielia litorea]|uniref:hypothetical protein n=1 Tax=Vannielia litorea TaxID=1217970 RepID=UPI001BCF0769|nr:hypothetical protein [Vannielia litorea]MBS8227705.1 hypothetical protein [Vannielia litorea]
MTGRHVLTAAVALLSMALPATALTCTPTTSCTIEGSCAAGSPESAFRLAWLDSGQLSLAPLDSPAPGEPPLHLTEAPGGDAALRSFITATSGAGDAVLLTLIDGRHFTLSVHGHINRTPYAFLSEGSCEGTL